MVKGDVLWPLRVMKKYVAIIRVMERYRDCVTHKDGKRDWEMDWVAASQAFVRSRGWKCSIKVYMRESWWAPST